MYWKMSYLNFKRDLDNIELFKVHKKFLEKVAISLSNPLSTDRNKLENQLIEAESFQTKVVHIFAAAKALEKEACGEAWKRKGKPKHGEAEIFKAEVESEIKEYNYLVTYLENVKDILRDRINLGKKLLGER